MRAAVSIGHGGIVPRSGTSLPQGEPQAAAVLNQAVGESGEWAAPILSTLLLYLYTHSHSTSAFLSLAVVLSHFGGGSFFHASILVFPFEYSWDILIVA
jgi:hypothetical protein